MSKSVTKPVDKWASRLMLRFRDHDRLAPLFVGGVALVVYLLTMAPVLAWGYDYLGRDGGDFVTAARFLGVPHPTGYPTFTLLAWLFTHLPLGSVAWRVHLLSGLASAGTVSFLYLIGRRLMRAADWMCPYRVAIWGAAVGALLLAFAPLFWAHAVIAEVYALHLFFIALIFWLMARWRDGDGSLWPAALAFGLGMGNHITLTFLGPAILLLLWNGRERLTWRNVVSSALALAAGLLIYLYLPWRAAANPLINWGDPDDWESFRWMVTGEPYRRFFFALPHDQLMPRLEQWWIRTGEQFPIFAWPLALLGLWDLARRDRWLASAFLIYAAINLVYSIGYDVSDAFVYLLPTYLCLALWMGQGTAFVLSIAHHLREPGWRSTVLVGVAVISVLALPVLSLVQEWGDMDLTHDQRAQEYAQEVLQAGAIEPGALILVDSDVHTFTLWYYHYVENLGPDVLVVNTPMLSFDWYQHTVAIHHPEVVLPGPRATRVTKLDHILRNLDQRPVYIAEDEDDLPGLELTPVGPLWRVTTP